MAERGQTIRSLVFDKDGVILDLAETWVPVIRAVAEFTVSCIPPAHSGTVDRAALLRKVGIDDDSGNIDPVGLFARGSHAEVRAAWQSILPDDMIRLESDKAYRSEAERISNSMSQGNAVAKGDVKTPLERLADAGFKLALLTNDSEESARRGLVEVGVAHLFDPFLGADSGFGAKPEPEGLLHCCAAHGSGPMQTIMIGDTGADYGVAKNARVADFICIAENPDHRPHRDIRVENVIAQLDALPDLLVKRGDMESAG